MNSRLLCLAIMASVSALMSCSSEDPAPEAAAATVTVTNNKYTPPMVTVKVGQIVEWQFQQGVHDVKSGPNTPGATATDPPKCTPDGKFNSGDPQASGTYRYKFTAAGTYPYFCSPHCDLKQFGTVVVTP